MMGSGWLLLVVTDGEAAPENLLEDGNIYYLRRILSYTHTHTHTHTHTKTIKFFELGSLHVIPSFESPDK